MPQQLPIDALLPAIFDALEHSPNLVIEAAPGAGKTTRVPPALLHRTEREILVLEPRRIAARMAARRVAFELGEAAGETVGYQVRFENVSGPKTRLRYLTEGVLTRRLVSEPLLSTAGIVVLDEFHERRLDTDLVLALLRRLQCGARPDLKLVVMSATLEADPVASFLGSCPVIRSEGRLFEITISHTPYFADPLERQVAKAVEALVHEKDRGDILVFLPGAAEIRKAASQMEPIARAHDLIITQLHGDLSPAEQDRAITPASRRKVILSTNVAESSLTVEGVTAVVDSGLARVASDAASSGLPTLNVQRISKASARQRAGRAGRTAPGRVIRLYTAEDFHRRPEQDTPEILRRELTGVCLDLKVLGIGDPLALSWLDSPPLAAVAAAEDLLKRLDVGAGTARRMSRLPLHPRLAKLAIEAEARGVPDDGCAAAALLSAGVRSESGDLIACLDREWEPNVKRTYEQLRRVVGGRQSRRELDPLLLAILSAFPDRVARRRRDLQVALSTGGSAQLPPSAHTSEFLIAVDLEDRRDKGLPLVRLFCATEPEWLIDLFPERVEERNTVEWNRTAERVDAVSALLYDQLVIQESRGTMPDAALAADLLASKASEAGIDRFVDGDELADFLARVAFASEYGRFEKIEPEEALRAICAGRRSFAELKAAAAQLIPLLEARAGGRLLNEIAPARLRLPGGRQTRVHYSAGKPPWISSRLQDFFGMRETPRIASGAVPVVVHLLAPNQRPVQTTTDLAGFWERLYPQLRRELGRRYPRHAWPADPAVTAPPRGS